LSGDEAEARLPSGNGEASFGLGFRRSLLDDILLEKAVTQSADVFQGVKLKVLKKAHQGWHLTIDSSEAVEELSARMLIGADGRNSWVAHHLGLVGGPSAQGRAIGFQLRLNSSNAATGKVEIHLFPGGYAGLVGLGGGVLNLCFAVDKARFQHERSFEELVESCLGLNPHLQQILCHSEKKGEIRSIYPVYFTPRRAYGDRVLLVGDAARVSEPVTGEGIYFALKSGELAAWTVDRAFRKSHFSARHLRLYERECRSAFQIRQGVNALLRWLIYRPALVSPFIRLTARRRRLLDSLVRTICQPEAYTEADSL
jgi:flavin-dependent dehydrogenase